MTPAEKRRLQDLPVSLVAEYEAAREEYARAMARLSAVKTEVTLLLEQALEKRWAARLAREAVASEGWLAGASTARAVRDHFINACLFHDELYGSDKAYRRDEDRERQLVALALERYRDTISKQERAA